MRAVTTPRIVRFVVGMGRNKGEEKQVSHIYVEYESGQILPMCRNGWNRSNGSSFSIFRGHVAAKGICKNCQRNRTAGKPGVEAKPGSHKTKWI